MYYDIPITIVLKFLYTWTWADLPLNLNLNNWYSSKHEACADIPIKSKPLVDIPLNYYCKKSYTSLDNWFSEGYDPFWSCEGHDPRWTSGFCKLLLNGDSHDTKIDYIQFLWAGAPLVGNFHELSTLLLLISFFLMIVYVSMIVTVHTWYILPSTSMLTAEVHSSNRAQDGLNNKFKTLFFAIRGIKVIYKMHRWLNREMG